MRRHVLLVVAAASTCLAAASPPPVNATLSRFITPLHFVSAAGPGRKGRRLNPHRQRRLTPDGLQMHGNMHTLGYFSADACVGTPPRKFDLIVDKPGTDDG